MTSVQGTTNTRMPDAQTARRNGAGVLRRWGPAALVFLVATGIALLGAGGISIWTDEAVSISAARREWPELWRLLGTIDAVHGAYYALLKVWIGVFGYSAFAVRALSALIVGGTALGVFVLAKRHASVSTALTAGLVAAALPRLTWAGIEARPFALSALLAVWATVVFSVALARRRALAWCGYAVIAALGVVVNVYLALLVLAHGVTVLVLFLRRRAVWAGYLSAAVAAALLSLPLLLLTRSQQSQIGTEGDRNPLSILRKLLINENFLGETPTLNEQSFLGPLPAEPVAPGWFTLIWQAASVLAAVLGLGFVLLALVRPARSGDDKRMLLGLTLPWAVLPAVLVAAYSVVASPMYNPRYFTFAAPAMALLIALGMRALQRRVIARILVLVYAVSCVVVIVSQRLPFAKSGSDWAMAAETVAAEARPGDAVYFTPHRPGGDPEMYTARRIAAGYPEALAGLDDITADGTGAETGTFDGYSILLADAHDRMAGHDRLWVVSLRSADPEIVAEDRALLEEEGFAGEIEWQGPGSSVVLYEQR